MNDSTPRFGDAVKIPIYHLMVIKRDDVFSTFQNAIRHIYILITLFRAPAAPLGIHSALSFCSFETKIDHIFIFPAGWTSAGVSEGMSLASGIHTLTIVLYANL